MQTDRLLLEIGEPGEIYRGARFDWTGIVRQVTLDGMHTFCTVEGGGTEGVGLTNEFGLFTPVGYEEARTGGRFPKIGVGLLTRDEDKPYDFFRPYEIKPFPMSVHAGSNEVVFTVDPVPCGGYAVRLKKTLRAEGNRLTVEYELENAGDRPIVTEEYNHNFLLLNGRGIGAEYALSADRPVAPEPRDPSRRPYRQPDAETVRWEDGFTGDFYFRVSGTDGSAVKKWRLENRAAGVYVEEYVSDAFRMAVWGTPVIISPEVFVRVEVQPGQKQMWSRRWEFGTLGSTR
jgi:hypothetical protein